MDENTNEGPLPSKMSKIYLGQWWEVILSKPPAAATYAREVILGKILNELLVYHFGMPRSWEVQKCENQNQGVPSAKVATKNSHQKPPKSPVGGISPSPLDETCWASNSVWKIGITSLIRITQSKVTPFQKSLKSPKMPYFQLVSFWTA